MKYVARFAMNGNTIRRHPATMIRLADMRSLSECDRFCTEFVGNAEFHVSHEQTIRAKQKENEWK